MDPTADTELLEKIAAFLDKSGMSPTAFGNKAAGDPRLVPDLIGGRELRRKKGGLRERVLTFIAEQLPSERPKPRLSNNNTRVG